MTGNIILDAMTIIGALTCFICVVMFVYFIIKFIVSGEAWKFVKSIPNIKDGSQVKFVVTIIEMIIVASIIRFTYIINEYLFNRLY